MRKQSGESILAILSILAMLGILGGVAQSTLDSDKQEITEQQGKCL